MRSSGRLLSSLQAPPSQLSKSLFVCSTCRQQFRPRALGVTTSRGNYRSASGSTPFTERVRRKIWGTDNPPGLKDPYGGESFVEKALRKRRGGEESGEVVESAAEPAVMEAAEEYIPATTWKGLEQVGSLGEWWDKQPTEVDYFNRFMSETKLTSRDEIVAALHQIMVEMSILQELKKPLTAISDLHIYDFEELSIISRAEVNPSEDKSAAVLSFADAEAKEKIFSAFERSEETKKFQQESLAAEAEAEQDSESDAHNAEENATLTSDISLEPPTNLNFLSITLEDPKTKFAVFKRTAQITGYRIPDHLIASIRSMSDLLKHLVAASKPKPKKLAESLVADETLSSLPNVKIMDRRMTPIDKEKEIGRWKIIEEELTQRGLPVTGRVPS